MRGKVISNMICQMCYEEEAIQGDTICRNCKEIINQCDEEDLDSLIEQMEDN
jgi:hypothetical protein